MNLYTEYTEEEIFELLSLTNNKYTKIKEEVKILDGLDDYVIDNEVKKIEVKEVSPKQIIQDYDLIYIIDGEVVLLNDNKPIKKIKKEQLVGVENFIKENNNHYIVTAKKSKLCFIELKHKKSVLINIIKMLLNNCVNK